ncbi:NADH-quinone oxidoreductase subunit C [Elusimicrobium minutum]|nr:NADH-quinone oxidoreductase subunit C [Elusimicrobium minutum]
MKMLKKNTDEELKELLEKDFDGMITDVTIKKLHRVYCMALGKDIYPITEILMNKLGFDYLCTITGVDCGDSIHALYHWGSKEGVLLTIEAVLPMDNLKLKSITPLIRGAVYYERELADLLGVEVEGLPEGNRYPLDEDFPKDQYPLRKNWDAAKYIKEHEKQEAEIKKLEGDNLCQK